jgi:hypothetical protein
VLSEPAVRITAALSESSRDLHHSLASISDADAVRRPDPRRWSVLDCVEHLVLAERGLLSRIVAAAPGEPLPEDSAREARAVGAVVNRSRSADAPEPARPAGRFPTLAHALEQFDTAREATLHFAREHRDDLALRAVMHPFFGILSGEEMLLVMCGHVRRHTDQIREIREAIPLASSTVQS